MLHNVRIANKMLTLLIMVYMTDKIQKYNLYSLSFQTIYTLLGSALMICTQFHLEQKHQFFFRDTLIGRRPIQKL